MTSDRSDSDTPAPPRPAAAPSPRRHIRLTSHSGGFGALPIHWGAPSAAGARPDRRHDDDARAPQRDRHALRLVQRLPRAGGGRRRAQAQRTRPTSPTPRRPTRSARTRSGASRAGSSRIDPWGAVVAEVFAAELAAGYDIRPTIAVTKAHVILPEVIEAIAERPAERRRPASSPPAARRWSPRSRSSRSGTCPASPSASAARRPTCAACCSRRPAACTPSW